MIDYQLMIIGDIAKDVTYAMATSTPTELWEPEQPGQRDSGGTQQMLIALVVLELVKERRHRTLLAEGQVLAEHSLGTLG